LIEQATAAAAAQANAQASEAIAQAREALEQQLSQKVDESDLRQVADRLNE
ncbi:unnamed protein product, partial [Amoebophrya sp. A25]